MYGSVSMYGSVDDNDDDSDDGNNYNNDDDDDDSDDSDDDVYDSHTFKQRISTFISLFIDNMESEFILSFARRYR